MGPYRQPAEGAMTRDRGYRLGVDVGGTFTDLVLAAPDGRALTRKVLSSAANYAEAIIEGTARAARRGEARAGRGGGDHPRHDRGHQCHPRAPRRPHRAAHDGRLSRPPGDRAPAARAPLRSGLRAGRAARAPPLAARGRRAHEPCRRGDRAARPDERERGHRSAARRGRRVHRRLLPARLCQCGARAGRRRPRAGAGAGRGADAVVRDPAGDARVRADEHHRHQCLRHAGDGAATSNRSSASWCGSASPRRSSSCSRTAA